MLLSGFFIFKHVENRNGAKDFLLLFGIPAVFTFVQPGAATGF